MRGDETKFDSGKPMWDLLPWEPVEAVVEVLTYGAGKYKPNGWKEVPDAHRRYTAALFRHLVAWQKGDDFDEESGCSHLAHALTNLVFLYQIELDQENEMMERI